METLLIIAEALGEALGLSADAVLMISVALVPLLAIAVGFWLVYEPSGPAKKERDFEIEKLKAQIELARVELDEKEARLKSLEKARKAAAEAAEADVPPDAEREPG